MGKREQNKVMVRERLLKEALHLFSEKGFEQTTVADIVAASEIGRGTFYNYFPDVKAIFDAVIEKLNSEIGVIIKKSREGVSGIYQFLFVSFKSYFDYVSSEEMVNFHRKNQAYIRSTSYGSDSIKRFVADLQEDFKSQKGIGVFREDYEFQLLSFVLVGAPAELFLNIHSTGVSVSNEQMAAFLAKMFTKVLER